MIVSDIWVDLKEILGKCDSTTIYSRLTDAITALSNKGDWDPMIGIMDICTTTDGRTITLPRDVETPLGVNVGGTPAFYRNKWFEFHLNGPGSRDFSCSGSGCNSVGGWAWDDQAFVPTFMDLIQASNLVAIADLKVDLNQYIQIFGFDQNGQWIRSQQPDGTWIEGFRLPFYLLSDFPGGIPIADTQRYFVRNFIPTKNYNFLSSTDHNFVTGSALSLSLNVAPMPTPFVAGTTYYAEVVDGTHVRLYATRTNALTQTNPIQITSYASTSSIRLSDRRNFACLSKFTTASAHKIVTGSLVEFTAAVFPTPIVASTNYFARPIDATNFQVHASLADALANLNAIDCSTAGTTVVAKVKQNFYPVTTLNFSTNHNYTTGDLVQVSSTGSLPSPLTTGISYYVYAISSTSLTLHETATDAATGVNPIILVTPGSGTLTAVKSIDASATTGTNNNIQTSEPHNLSLTGGDFVQFSTTGTFPTPITQGTVYRAEPPSSTTTFSLNTTVPAAVNITALGTGQLKLLISRVFTVGFTGQWSTDTTTLTNGGAVKITSTGALPGTNPAINSTTDYYTRVISDTIAELYTTSAYALDTAIRTSATRSRASNVATVTTAANHLLTTGDYVDIANLGILRNGVLTTVTVTVGGAGFINGELGTLTDGAGNQATGTLTVAAGVITDITIVDGGEGFVPAGALSISAPSGGGGTTLSVNTITDNVATPDSTFSGNRKQVTVTGVTTFTYACTGLDVAAVADVSGIITISKIRATTLGSGSIYLNRELAVTVNPYSSEVKISTEYLKDGALVQLETTGTLPAPLALATDYLITIESSGFVSFSTSGGVPITITNLGSGTHTLVISKTFLVDPTNTYDVSDNNYTDGDAVVVSSTGTVPTPLVSGTTYYIRRISDDTIELYDTEAHAENTASTTGRLVATTVGSGTHSITQTLDAFQVGKIDRIQKPTTQGFTHLYAMDYGRSNDITKIGFYYPDENDPQYRRIRVPSACCWVRLRYRRRTFQIKSDQDYIPLTSRLAIIFMVRAIQLLRDNFLQEGAGYEALALKYLQEEEAATEGPDSMSLQFNTPIMTGSDEMCMM